MHIFCRKNLAQKNLAKSIFILCAISSGIIGSSHWQKANAISTESNDSASAIFVWKKPLKTKVPSPQDKHPARYILEVQTSQTVKPIGSTGVRPVEKPININSGNKESAAEIKQESVAITRPPLQALISVQENLNPFSLDAQYIEGIDLEESLRTALGQNLNIENNFSQLRIQNYSFLSAASRFLPDINGGYNLVGLKGSFPASLLGESATSVRSALSGSGGSVNLPSAAQVITAGFTYHAYQGGKVLFTTLQERHRLRAARAALKGSINDVLLDTAKRYYDLLLNESFLSTRTRTVEISKEQVRMNSLQEKHGLATGLDVLQSQAQLASDEQNLVDQQQVRRHSAIQLAHILNTSFSQDLISKQTDLRKKD